MPGVPFPPLRRRWRVALILAGAAAVYLLALSIVPAVLGTRDDTAGRRERGRRAVRAENWALVLPDERAALGRAVDDAWRALRGYRMRYTTGLPAALASGAPETESESVFRLTGGRIAAQRDRNYISAASPAGGGREERFEGFRILTSRPFTNSRGQRVADAEEIYQRAIPGQWACERVAADRALPPAPGLDFTTAGDGGFGEIDGRRVRAFLFPAGAFGLRSAATVWIETDTLRVRRQEIESALKGRREVWEYSAFDETFEITPPTGVPCRSS